MNSEMLQIKEYKANIWNFIKGATNQEKSITKEILKGKGIFNLFYFSPIFVSYPHTFLNFTFNYLPYPHFAWGKPLTHLLFSLLIVIWVNVQALWCSLKFIILSYISLIYHFHDLFGWTMIQRLVSDLKWPPLRIG